MASAHQQQQGNDLLKSIGSNLPACFFKIILQDIIRNGKLGIPRKFVKNHGNYMSSPALLRVPSGAVWKVELTKCDDKIWLEKGWLEFSNHYSLDFGHLLVFRYDGNSTFHVHIFDRSASEIQYPYTSNNHRRSDKFPEQIIDKSVDDDSINILENISSSRKMRVRSQSPCRRPHKMMRNTNSAIKTETECNEHNEFLGQQVSHNGCPTRKDDKRTSQCIIQRSEAAEALERVSKTFKSENPFFIVFMHPSYIGLGHAKLFRLSIPRNFVEKHLMKEHYSVILCNSSGKTWIATFKKRQRGKRLNSFLLAGWATFVRDNNIQIGDVCAFELINSIKLYFKVVIYKGQHANCHQPLTSTDVCRLMKRKPPSYARQCCLKPLTTPEKAKAFQIARAFKSENPFFVVELRPSYVHSNKLNIPVNFAKKYLTDMHKEVILLLSNGKSWQVMYDQHRLERFDVNLRNGWRRFAEDNKLEVGDACVFELMKGAKTSMNVTIYKKQAVEEPNLGGSSLGDKSREKQVEVHESLVIKTETARMLKGKGDMCNLHNQHNRTSDLKMKENSEEPTGEILDDISMSKISSSGKPLEEASQSYQSLQQNEGIQDTNRLD